MMLRLSKKYERAEPRDNQVKIGTSNELRTAR